MKKYLVILGVLVIFGGYFLFLKKNNAAPAATVAAPAADTTAPATADNVPAAAPAGGGTPPAPAAQTTAPAPASQGLYKDGGYTSPVEDAYFGSLQFRVTVSGGKISDVTFLQYPNANQHSVEVTSQSTPILKSEAIAAQSASVNIVSGATQTSEAFQQGLAAVLAQAKN